MTIAHYLEIQETDLVRKGAGNPTSSSANCSGRVTAQHSIKYYEWVGERNGNKYLPKYRQLVFGLRKKK